MYYFKFFHKVASGFFEGSRRLYYLLKGAMYFLLFFLLSRLVGTGRTLYMPLRQRERYNENFIKIRDSIFSLDFSDEYVAGVLELIKNSINIFFIALAGYFILWVFYSVLLKSYYAPYKIPFSNKSSRLRKQLLGFYILILCTTSYVSIAMWSFLYLLALSTRSFRFYRKEKLYFEQLEIKY